VYNKALDPDRNKISNDDSDIHSTDPILQYSPSSNMKAVFVFLSFFNTLLGIVYANGAS
jgi:hypothetical protein